MPLETIKFSELSNGQLLGMVTPSADFDPTTDQFYPAADAVNEVQNRGFNDVMNFAAYTLKSAENANGYGRFATAEEMANSRTTTPGEVSENEKMVYGGDLKRNV